MEGCGGHHQYLPPVQNSFLQLPPWVLRGRGTGKATMDLKMVQELVSVNQEPLFLVFLVFLDLKKAYDTVYHGSLINNLEG